MKTKVLAVATPTKGSGFLTASDIADGKPVYLPVHILTRRAEKAYRDLLDSFGEYFLETPIEVSATKHRNEETGEQGWVMIASAQGKPRS